MRGTALLVNGTEDHVHLLTRVRPVHSAAEMMRIIKANSSKWVHEKWKTDFGWQTGYGVFSVSESSVDAVTTYIARQEEHHRKQSFQEEFLAFLKKTMCRTTRGFCGIRFFAPLGLTPLFAIYPQLALWATF